MENNDSQLNSQLNSAEYIEAVLTDKSNEQMLKDEFSSLIVSMKISLYSLFMGRKWIIFVILSMLPLVLSQIVSDPLFGNDDAKSAFVDVYLGFFYFLLFSFGALLISLPLSADELSDHITDLYMVRPIRRETYWLSKWMIVNLGIFLVNSLIAIIYYIYFQLVDGGTTFIADMDVLLKIGFFTLLASLTYGGLYIFVGSIGNKGFTLALILSLVEPFLLSLLFLRNSKYIPRTHFTNIVADLFPSADIGTVRGLTLEYSYTYLFFFSFAFLIIGAIYYRRKEFV